MLPLADFKSITVEPTPTEAPVSYLGTELAVAGGVLLVILLVFLLPRLRPKAKAAPEEWILIDGSNVMHWQDNTPRLEPVREVIAEVRKKGYVPGVVFDANAGWKLEGRYMHDGDFARLLEMDPAQVLVVEKGTQADPFLLQTAREFGARIVSNDRFRDWAADHPEVEEPGFLIPGGIQGGKLRLDGLPAPSRSAKVR